MGGIGSGRGMRWNTKRTKGFVEGYKSIDARSFTYNLMKKIPSQGMKSEAHGVEIMIFGDKLEVHYREGDKHIGYRIFFSLSDCNYGNQRYWFLCPALGCSKRVRKLFLVSGKDGLPQYICRHCLNLAFRSQNSTELDRVIDRKWDLVRKLGCDSFNIFNQDKPKGMHWKTFNRIREMVENLHEEADRKIGAAYVAGSVDWAINNLTLRGRQSTKLQG